jgi:large subunit ribosomal protein L1
MMTKRGKKYRKAVEAIASNDQPNMLAARDALALVKSSAYAKFDETIDVHVNLGIDPEKGEQVVRSSVVLPHSTGKIAKVLVFARGDQATEALKAGADYVGAEDLIQKIESGWLEFNFAVATPDMMIPVGKVARILGPRGLLPNKKTGTVTDDVAKTVADLKRGRLFFKNDKSGLVHFSIGKVSSAIDSLLDNFRTFIRALAAAKPAAARGVFIQKITIASTMGVGVQINPAGL